MKKLIALALLAAFLVSAGVGCSGGPTGPTNAPKTTGGTSTAH